MEMSVVEKFDVPMAQRITGKKNVEQLLEQAMEIGDFIIKKGAVYQYKNAFLESMRRRLKRNMKEERIHRLYCNVGYCYEMRGEISKALEAYASCQDEDEVSRLLIANARENPAHGHYFELRRYYLSLSEETIRESAVLIACMSMLQSILMNVEESERWYEELKRQKGSAEQAALPGHRSAPQGNHSDDGYLQACQHPHSGAQDLPAGVLRYQQSSISDERGKGLLRVEQTGQRAGCQHR